ncbi:hypothetical protein [Rhizocola hellebori]|uniref:hypothetical protein n=1 Tax=Rhizocola hellebori TaxID=1392758 RepID=UPI001944D177|nr:hypothetical protein [Rhizocola hellebori]
MRVTVDLLGGKRPAEHAAGEGGAALGVEIGALQGEVVMGHAKILVDPRSVPLVAKNHHRDCG